MQAHTEHDKLINDLEDDYEEPPKELPENLKQLQETTDSFFRAALAVIIAIFAMAVIVFFGRLFTVFIPITYVSDDPKDTILTCPPNTTPLFSLPFGTPCVTQISGNTCMYTGCQNQDEGTLINAIVCVCKYSPTS